MNVHICACVFYVQPFSLGLAFGLLHIILLFYPFRKMIFIVVYCKYTLSLPQLTMSKNLFWSSIVFLKLINVWINCHQIKSKEKHFQCNFHFINTSINTYSTVSNVHICACCFSLLALPGLAFGLLHILLFLLFHLFIVAYCNITPLPQLSEVLFWSVFKSF